MSNTNTSIEVPGPVENSPEFSQTLTPTVLEELKDAFSEKTEPTVHEIEIDELREVFEADQEEAAELEEAMAIVEPVANEVSEKTVKPRFGSRRPERKPIINLLDTNTKLGRFVSMAVFGEKSSSTPTYKVPKPQRTSKPIHEMTGGNLSQDYVNKINYPR